MRAEVDECGTPTGPSPGQQAPLLLTPRCLNSGPCPKMGFCDCVSERDQWLAPTQNITIRVKFHIFDNDVLQDLNRVQRVQDQIDKINADFQSRRIQFDAEPPIFYDDPEHSAYRVIETNEEAAEMKTIYADSPATKLNVYVCDFDPLGFNGRGTFPWYPEANTAQGGILNDGEAFSGDRTTLTHEIGHNLGLWHTHHGVSELLSHGECNPALPCTCDCYETAERIDCDVTGDFCCDTPSTPVHYTCDETCNGDPCSAGNPDPCPECTAQTKFCPTDYDNFMGYARDVTVPPCRDHYTDQQAARMQCWACDVRTGWMSGEQLGRCCLPDGSCDDLLESCCVNRGGTFGGDGTSCGSSGACCLGGGICQSDNQDPVCCALLGGTFAGAGTSCSSVGACCLSSGGCAAESQACCTALSRTFLGIGTTCSVEEAACCVPGGQCIETTQACCAAMDGWWRSPNLCPGIHPPCPEPVPK